MALRLCGIRKMRDSDAVEDAFSAGVNRVLTAEISDPLNVIT